MLRTTLVALLMTTSVAAASPSTMTHSGRVLDAQGEGVTQTSDITFTLYDDSGVSIWSESLNTPLSNGYYAAVLGAGSPLPASAFLADTQIGVSIGGQELSRQSLHSTPSAMSGTGAVQLTAAPPSCDGTTLGALRGNATTLQVCDGTSWRSIAAEPAAGITPTDITEWDEAHAWGDHGSAGYVTTDTLGALTCLPNEQPVRSVDGTSWVCGTPPGSSLIAMGSPGWTTPPNFVSTTLPNGETGQVHQSTGNGVNTCYAWARSPQIATDPTKTYEYSIWVKSDDNELNNYLGFHVYDAGGTRIEAAWDNPYFKTSESDPNTWVRHTGYLLPAGTQDTNGDGRPDNQLGASTGLDWILPAATRTARMRFGSCYSSVDGGVSLFAEPQIREVDPATAMASNLRIYRDSETATMTSTSNTAIPNLSVSFFAVANTPVTLQLWAHQRCNDSYFYNDLLLDSEIVGTAGTKGHTTWRINNSILWNGTVSSTGTHTVTGTWAGGTACTPNTSEFSADGHNVSITAWVGE
jgi:hypothetical protein